MYVTCPTKGSDMILNASAENGCSSEARRSAASSFSGLVPSTGGTSSGDGRKSTTASSSGYAFVFEGRARKHGSNFQRDGRAADGSAQLFRRQGVLGEEFLKDGIVVLGDVFDDLVAVFFVERLVDRRSFQRRRDVRTRRQESLVPQLFDLEHFKLRPERLLEPKAVGQGD